jgi:hypothetical protein
MSEWQVQIAPRAQSQIEAPGDGEVTGVPDETMGEKDPLLAKLLAAATAGMPPAGPANTLFGGVAIHELRRGCHPGL